MSPHNQADPLSVTIRDESVPRSEVVDALLQLSSGELRARDLITERVRTEWDRKLRNLQGHATRTLVEPMKKETALNGEPKKPGPADVDKQIDVALDAFESNGFILLVDDQQIETLDTPLSLTPDSVVTFLRLTPLVGG